MPAGAPAHPGSRSNHSQCVSRHSPCLASSRPADNVSLFKARHRLLPHYQRTVVLGSGLAKPWGHRGHRTGGSDSCKDAQGRAPSTGPREAAAVTRLGHPRLGDVSSFPLVFSTVRKSPARSTCDFYLKSCHVMLFFFLSFTLAICWHPFSPNPAPMGSLDWGIKTLGRE